MKLALDTSAIAKRYKQERERGRDRLLALLQNTQQLVVATHTKIELASIFSREVHDRLIAADAYTQVMGDIEADFRDIEVQNIDAQTERLAMSAMLLSRIRVMDALHLGAALTAKADLFVTADVRQAAAARAVGLNTELLEE